MFTIKFEAKSLEDLKNQVNTLLDDARESNDKQRMIDEMTAPETETQQVIDTPKIQPEPVADPPVQESQPAQTVAQQPVTTTEVKAPAIRINDNLDSAGVPWDSRIHSSSRQKVRNGEWKKKRGVDRDLLDKVEAELKGSKPAVAAVVPPVPDVSETVGPAAQPAPTVQPPEVAPPTTQPTQAPAEPQPVYDTAPVPVPNSVKPMHSVETFQANFANVLAQLKQEGKLTPEYIKSLCDHFQVKEFWEVINYPEKLQVVFDSFVQYGWITKAGV